MLHYSIPRIRRAAGLATMLASLLLLGQVPVAHVMSSIRPAAAETPIPTEEEQRSDVAERVWQAQVSLRHRRHATYQETVELAPPYRRHSAAASLIPLHGPPPSAFPGAPRPLRC